MMAEVWGSIIGGKYPDCGEVPYVTIGTGDSPGGFETETVAAIFGATPEVLNERACLMAAAPRLVAALEGLEAAVRLARTGLVVGDRAPFALDYSVRAKRRAR